jgi:hypothetical protein
VVVGVVRSVVARLRWRVHGSTGEELSA